jgi:hypothetical protein
LILIGGFVTPIEAVVEDLHLELSTIKETLGNRNFAKTDIPAVMWKAVKSSFYMINSLEEVLFSCNKVAHDDKELSKGLLEAEEDHCNGSDLDHETKSKDNDTKPSFLKGLN